MANQIYSDEQIAALVDAIRKNGQEEKFKSLLGNTGSAPALSPVSTAGSNGYTNPYAEQMDTLLNNMLNFQYDPQSDPIYQNYKNQYQMLGNSAYQDTLGNAAAMSSGMPSSYAISAASQARDQYNAKLNEKIPELYQAAYSMYSDRYNLLNDREKNDYDRYRDSVTDKRYDQQWTASQTQQEKDNAYRDKTFAHNSAYQDKVYNRDVYESDRDYEYKRLQDELNRWYKYGY